jgi:Leucine-rich repeat (LRR) protein
MKPDLTIRLQFSSFVLSLFLASGLTASAQVSSNLAVNGSFELGNYVAAPNARWMSQATGSTNIAGWLVADGGPNAVDWHDTDQFRGVKEGNFCVDMNGGGVLEQELTGLEPGLYEVAFWMIAPTTMWGGVPGWDYITIGGEFGDAQAVFTKATHDFNYSSNYWEQFSFLATVTSGSSTLRLSSLLGTMWGPVIDLVSVRKVAGIQLTGPDPQHSAFVGDTVTLSVTASSALPLAYQWEKSGGDLTNSARISGVTTSTLTISGIEVADAGGYRVRVSNDSLTLRSATCALLVVTNFATGGDSVWFAQSTNTHDGVEAWQSGPLNDDEENWLEATVTGPGLLRFWWAVDSEEGFDFLVFEMDGDYQADISGASTWSRMTLDLGEGTHTLRWTYSKDGSEAEGADAGWVDRIKLFPAPPPITNVAFVDPNLEQAVRETLDIPAPTPLTPEDLGGLTGLDAWSRGITNLSGLEAAVNLDWLNLAENSGIADFTPLAALPKLTYLELNSCGVSHLDFIAALPVLEELYVSGGTFTDLSPLADCDQLLALDLSGNLGITNFAVLASLPQLEWGLNLEDTGIANIAFVASLPNLRSLNLWAGNVRDLGPLANATNLVELQLGYNAVANAAPLAGCTNLESLDLHGNQISDLNFLSGLAKLIQLNLDSTPIQDISPLAGLTNLTHLVLNATLATNLATVTNLTQLTQLHVRNLGLTNASFLAALTHLRVLDAADNALTALPPYPSLSRLWHLNLERNPLANLNFIAGLTNLTELYLNESGLRDLSPLSGHATIAVLGLARNGITDLAPLATLQNLRWVTLWGNNVQNIAALSGLTNLSYVDLRHNLVDWFGPSPSLTVIQTLQGRGVTADYDPQQPGAIFLLSPARTDGQFQFTLHSAPNSIAQIWSSTNLTSWESVGYATNVTGSVGFTNTSAMDRQFYRATPQ